MWHSQRQRIRARKSRNCWDIFLLNCSFSQRQAMDSPTSAEALPLFYSEPYIQVGVYPHHETDRWQLHRHGSREGPRTTWKAIWQQGRAGMSDCEGFGMGPELQSCVGRRPQSRKHECAAEGEVGELQEAPDLTEDRHTLRGWCCLFMNVRLECILASVRQVTWRLCAPALHCSIYVIPSEKQLIIWTLRTNLWP